MCRKIFEGCVKETATIHDSCSFKEYVEGAFETMEPHIAKLIVKPNQCNLKTVEEVAFLVRAKC